MNLVIIVLLAALVVALAVIVNSKSEPKEEEETPEPLVNPNFGLDLESPAAPVVAPEEVVPQTIVSDEELEILAAAKAEIKKAVKSTAVAKASKTVAKTSAKAAPKKTVTKKSK